MYNNSLEILFEQIENQLINQLLFFQLAKMLKVKIN